MQCRSAKALKHDCDYWSSTEYNNNNAFNFNFNNGNSNNNNKNNTYRVRAVRDFSNKTIFRKPVSVCKNLTAFSFFNFMNFQLYKHYKLLTDLQLIQDLPVRASTQTTVRYTHVSVKQITNIQSPLDKLDL
jgi:hypothetical protein